MGCCESFCKKDNGSQGVTADETTRLLDPVRNTTNIPTVNSNDYVNPYSSPVSKPTDETAALNRILHETAANVIDVGALDSHNLEQHEYMDRSRAYAKKIEVIGVQVPDHPPCLLKDVPAPERVLAGEGLLPQDRDLMNDMLNGAVAALADIQVEHKEDLVVPFLS